MLKKYLIYFNNIFKILFQHVNQYEELLMSNCIYFCVPSLCNLVYFIFTVYFDLDQSHLNAQKSHVTPCLPYWTILSSAINHLRLLTHCIRFSEIVLNIYHHFSNKTGNYWTMMTNDLDFNLDFFFSIHKFPRPTQTCWIRICTVFLKSRVDTEKSRQFTY